MVLVGEAEGQEGGPEGRETAAALHEGAGTLGAVVTVALVVVLVMLGVALGVVESFVHPTRLFGLPVGVVGAAVVNLVVTHLVGRGTRSRPLAMAPGATWLGTVLVLSVGRPEGDFVVASTWIGYGYLIAGTLGVVVGAFLLPAYHRRDSG